MVDLSGKYESDPAMGRVSLGLDTQHFITHDKVGMYLVERAHSDRVSALEQLASANPTDMVGIIGLQMKARIPDLFLAWLDEAIANGIAEEEFIIASDG